MAIENFEGKNIQNTFQRVVQTDSTNQLADGTGSIFIPVSSSHAITASHALFAVSASHEITFEISSSHAVNADTASFATNFTASGNISASGNILGDSIRASSGFVGTINTIAQPNITSVGTLTGLNVNSNITASGNISSSGRIIGQDLELNGNITASGIAFGNTNKLELGDKDGNLAGTRIEINNSTAVTTFSGNSQLKLRGVRVILNNDAELDNARIELRGPVTASGNISASGTIEALTLTAQGGAFANRIDRVDDAKTGIQFPDGIFVTENSHITASGDISSSGTIRAQDYIIGNRKFAAVNSTDLAGISLGNAGDGNLLLNHLTASGNISASGDLTVNNINGTIDGGTF